MEGEGKKDRSGKGRAWQSHTGQILSCLFRPEQDRQGKQREGNGIEIKAGLG